MKSWVVLGMFLASASSFAGYQMECVGSLARVRMNLEAPKAFAIVAPRSAYRMHGNDARPMSETCSFVTSGNATMTFGCYGLNTTIKFPSKVIYAISFLEGARRTSARQILDAIVYNNQKVPAQLSTFDNADESTPIELSSFTDKLSCTVFVK